MLTGYFKASDFTCVANRIRKKLDSEHLWCTVDIDASTELPRWCCLCCFSDKLSVLFRRCHRWQTYSHFHNTNLRFLFFWLKLDKNVCIFIKWWFSNQFCQIKNCCSGSTVFLHCLLAINILWSSLIFSKH